jgi:hypothetical protein
MQYKFESLPEKLQKSIIEKSHNLLCHSKTTYWYSTIIGLSKMQYNWKSDVNIEKAIFEGIIVNYHPTKKIERKYSAGDIAVCVYFLGEISNLKGASFTLDPEVLNCVWNGIENCSANFKPNQLCSLIYG